MIQYFLGNLPTLDILKEFAANFEKQTKKTRRRLDMTVFAAVTFVTAKAPF